jgi:uncharacterized membrane protein
MVHIVAGLAAVVAGAIAISVTKGGRLHRSAGAVFVWAMVVMGLLGAIIAATRLYLPVQRINVAAGLFTAYLVTTSLLTVRPLRTRWIDISAAGLAFSTSAGCFALVLASLGQATNSWFPAVPATIFGSIALLAAVGDVRMIRTGPLRGKKRIARHLWRMCVAMFIAIMSFSVQQSKVLPAEMHGGTALGLLSLVVLATMAWYLVRLNRGERKPRVESAVAPMPHPTA